MIDKDRLAQLWKCCDSSQIAAIEGMTVNAVNYYARRYGLPKKARKNLSDPTEEQIAERAAAIRSQWSDEELEKRYVGAKAVEWTTPEIRLSGVYR